MIAEAEPKVYREEGPHGLVTICTKTGKQRYNSMMSAERMMAHLILHGGASQIPCRAYPCRHCDGWHLTSKARRRR